MVREPRLMRLVFISTTTRSIIDHHISILIFFQCWISVLVQGFQSLFGLLIDAALIGIFFAKMSRPGYRAETVVWSKNAVVSLRDGVLCLVWQVSSVTMVMMVIISISPGRGYSAIPAARDAFPGSVEIQLRHKRGGGLPQQHEVRQPPGMWNFQ